jgi:hypothetical protein
VPYIRRAEQWIAELKVTLREFQRAHIQKIIDCCISLQSHLADHPDALLDMKAFTDDWHHSCLKHPTYLRLRKRRHILRSWVQTAVNRYVDCEVIRVLRIELVKAGTEFNVDTSYSPPSVFDEILQEFIIRDPMLSVMVTPAAMIIVQGASQSLLYTLGEFNTLILGKLGIKAGPPRAIVYTSLVRFLFGIAYTIRPTGLFGSPEDNARFLIACERFSRQTVRDLRLSDAITRNYTPGLHVASLFNQKHVELLAPMELMTNPIDLMSHVGGILQKLATFYASEEGFLSFDDTLTLLLALLCLNPPSNALAIREFVAKWSKVQLSRGLEFAKDYFIAAVDQIQSYASDHPDNDEEQEAED